VHAAGACRFLVIQDPEGRFGWILINPNGTPTARSGRLYGTDGEARQAAEHARAQIADAPIIDEQAESDVRA
jgi:hypothetical protein